MEDTCSYFADGLKHSVEPNKLNGLGFPTAIRFDPEKPTVIRHIQGVAQVPADFRKVADVEFGDRTVTFRDVNGKSVTAAVDYQFVMEK